MGPMALPMKKAMKAAGAMKKAGVMKAMKAKRVSKIAKGNRAKSSVFSGRKGKTVGGLTKADLIKSKSGKVVSKKASLRAKKAYATSAIKKWADAVKAARKALGLSGFVAIGGKTGPGRALYSKAKSLMA